MPEVNFYILPTELTTERNLFACKLIEKAYRSDVFPYVLSDSFEQSQQLDDLLWTFRAGSFVPHEVYTGIVPARGKTVLIGSINTPAQWCNTIINLAAQCPPDFQNAERILEILDDSEETKAQGRKRYREYQQAGIDVTTYKIES
ncbi:DNA polymerase III subunit chi [biofilm metagenome]